MRSLRRLCVLSCVCVCVCVYTGKEMVTVTVDDGFGVLDKATLDKVLVDFPKTGDIRFEQVSRANSRCIGTTVPSR